MNEDKEIRQEHTAVQARVSMHQLDDALAAEVAATFKVLGDPTRVKILHLLAQGELCVHDLASLLNASDSAISHHLKILRMLRLVKGRREGRQVYYSLDDEHVLGLLRACSEHVEHS